MLNPSSSLARLIDAPIRPGRLSWIGVRPARREPMRVVAEARLEAGGGLVGDRYSRLDGERQVTLIEAESLAAIASHLGLAEIIPAAVRRNLVTEGINLLALKERRFRIGEAVLETSGECHPCSRMEETLGVGGYNAVRGLGGITARVVTSGLIRIGDCVERIDSPAEGAA
jgi:MOSC domain-containing protein YiiM